MNSRLNLEDHHHTNILKQAHSKWILITLNSRENRKEQY